MSDISDNGSFNSNLANISSANYGPTAITNQANTNASTQLAGAQAQNTQQQTQAAAMENQLMRARMPLILAGIHNASIASSDTSGVAGKADNDGNPVGGGATDRTERAPGDGAASQAKSAVPPDQNVYQPDLINAALRAKYTVPVMTPEESQDMQAAYMRDPQNKQGMGPAAWQARRDVRIANQTQQSQVGARDDFDKMSAVVDAPDGKAMDILEASHPETTAAIKRQLAKDPNQDQDEDALARMFAQHTAGEVHQYTGRKAVEDKAGVYRDESTQLPIPGVDKVGLSTDQYVKLAHEALTASVDVPDGFGGSTKVTPWRAAQIAGAKNINGPADWIMVQASQKGLPGGSATLSPNSAPKQAAQKVAQKALATAQAAHAAAPAPTNGEPAATPSGVGVAKNARGQIDPKLTAALQDESFTYHPKMPDGSNYVAGINKTPPPSVSDDMLKQTKARTELKQTSSEGVMPAQAALTMYKAAQDILAKGVYDGGAWNQELAKYGKWLPDLAKTQAYAQRTGDYQELTKYLGNAALQAGKGIFSKMTEKESEAVMHDLNPSPGMTTQALNEMIGRGVRTAQYSLDSAKRVGGYLNAGKDATQFNTWNATHFPMEEATKSSTRPGQQTSGGSKDSGGFIPGKKYTDKNGNSSTYVGNGKWQ